jgi:hypothetical protein
VVADLGLLDLLRDVTHLLKRGNIREDERSTTYLRIATLQCKPAGRAGPSRVADRSQVDLAFAERRQLLVCGFFFSSVCSRTRGASFLPSSFAHAISDP